MLDNAEENQEPVPENITQDPQPEPQPIESDVPRETISNERPENVPEKFWNADTGEIRTDELLKSNEHLEKFVGGKKDELRDEIINELSEEAESEVPEEYALPALPETITEEDVVENPLFDWWKDHCVNNAYNQEMFEDGINKFITAQSHFGADDYEYIQTTLGQSARGIEILEKVMDMQKQNISRQQSEPMNKLSLEDVRSMMKDPRYFDPKERDESFVRQVDDAFQRLYR